MSAGLEDLGFEAEAEAPPRHRGRAPRNSGKRNDKRRRRVWIWVTAVLVVVLLPVGLIGGYLFWLGASFDDGVGRISHAFPAEKGRPAPVAGVTNILLVGSDSRTGLGDVMKSGPTGDRSDTLMLVHIPADRSGVVIVSLMRDLWVPIPGHGHAKLNAAFSWGGTSLAVQTVEGLLDARIDHVMVVDFGGFGSIATALGGVEVWSDRAFTSKNMPGYSFEQGINTVEGSAALAFVRERYSFADADFQRVRNQQAFIRGVLHGFISKETLLNPLRTQAAIQTLAKYLAADSGLTAPVAGGLAFGLNGLKADAIRTLTLPTAGTGTSPDGQSIVRLDDARTAELRNALAADDVMAVLDSGALGNGRK